MGAQSLPLLNFNTRGLRDYNKRSNLLFKLKEKGTDIAFLQETYWTENLSKKIKQEWDGLIILNHGTEHSRGTAMLFKKELPINILKVSKGAKIRNRYNQVPHLTQDTNGKVTNSQ